MSNDEECAVWHVQFGASGFELAGSEAEAAGLAAAMEDADDGGVILGVQFADGRVIAADAWPKLEEARTRRDDAAREAFDAPRRPARNVRDPFSGRVTAVDVDGPAWVGLPCEGE